MGDVYVIGASLEFAIPFTGNVEAQTTNVTIGTNSLPLWGLEPESNVVSGVAFFGSWEVSPGPHLKREVYGLISFIEDLVHMISDAIES